MTIQTIKKEIVKMISDLFIDRGFDVEAIEYLDFIADVGMDSITFISLVVEIESHFNIEVPNELLTLSDFNNVEKITSIVTQELLNR